MLKLIETLWRTKLTFCFKEITELKFTGSTLIAPQLLSCEQNNSNIRDPRQILGGIVCSMTWPQKFFPGLVHLFLRFSGIFYGNMNFTVFCARITKIGFSFASAQQLLSYKQIQKPVLKSILADQYLLYFTYRGSQLYLGQVRLGWVALVE